LERGLLCATLALGVADMWRARHQVRIITAHWQQFALWFFMIAGVIVVAVATLDAPKPPLQALAGTIWILSWIVYVTVLLSRALPVRDGVMPEFLLRGPGIADALLIAGIVVGAGYYYGCGMFFFCS
jgi:FtsH-binding integral membrane protein